LLVGEACGAGVGVEVLRCTVSRSGLGGLTRLLRDAGLIPPPRHC
jgi:hypothetical protein